MNKKMTLKDIFKEVFSKGYLSRAAQRAQRRKSPWNLILVPLFVFGMLLSYAIQVGILWGIHILIYPTHAGKLSEVFRTQTNVSFLEILPYLLFIVPILFSSLVLGLMIANLLAWCIPPARRVFDAEAESVTEAGWVSFRESMMALTIGAVFLVPICLFLGLIGAFTLKTLK